MSRRLRQRSRKDKQVETGQVPQSGLNDDLVTDNYALQKAFTDSLRSLIERAVTDAEQIVDSIKVKAQIEAEEEAVRIIDQARQGAAEMSTRTEEAARKQAEDILSALNGKGEITEAEAKQIAQLYLLKARDEIEKEVREEYKQAHSRLLYSLLGTRKQVAPPHETPTPVQIERELDTASKEKEAKLAAKEEAKRKAEEAKKAKEAQKQAEKEAKLAAKEEAKRKAEEAREIKEVQAEVEEDARLAAEESALEEKLEEPAQLLEEPVQLEAEVTSTEPAETITEEVAEQHPPEKKPSEEEPGLAPLELDREALYEGEVELAIAVPVNPAAVSKLYNYLQTASEIKILYTRGSWERGTTITVSLDKQLPLIDIISKLPGLEIAPAAPQKNNSVKGTSSTLLGTRGKKVTRIDLSLKER